MTKAREFWISYVKIEPTCYAVNDEQEGPPENSPYHRVIHVREIRGYDHVLTGAELEQLFREVATGEKSDTDAMLEVLKKKLQRL